MLVDLLYIKWRICSEEPESCKKFKKCEGFKVDNDWHDVLSHLMFVIGCMEFIKKVKKRISECTCCTVFADG